MSTSRTRIGALTGLTLMAAMAAFPTPTAGRTGEPDGKLDLAACPSDALLCEDFEDADFASRGWYDSNGGVITDQEHAPGSGHSFACVYPQGGRVCEGGTPARHLFEPADAVYFEYSVKYAEGFVGSQRPYHPHEFLFLTNKDGPYVGPAGTHLTTYVEALAGVPRLALQDLLNVDTRCILRNDDSFVGCNGNFDTFEFTENRSVASCNGLEGDLDGRDCFPTDDTHWYSARIWDSPAEFNLYDGQWHHVAALFGLNSIVGGKGQVDGEMRYWLDGELILSYDRILYRTAANADMQFNQLLVAPYIGDGSPIRQAMYVDDLRIRRVGSASDPPPPAFHARLVVPFAAQRGH